MITIHIIKMIHANEEMVKSYYGQGKASDQIEEPIYKGIAKSQYGALKKVLKLLKDKHNIPVIYDGQSCQMATTELREKVKVLFPEGLPDRFDALTVDQKLYIVNYGMIGYLLANDVIPSLSPDDPRFDDSVVQQHIPFASADFCVQREFHALNLAMNLAKFQNVEEAIILYGRVHDFDLQNCFSEDSVKILIYENPWGLEDLEWQKRIADSHAHYLQDRSFTEKKKCAKLRKNQNYIDQQSTPKITCYPTLYIPFEQAPKPIAMTKIASDTKPQSFQSNLEIQTQHSDGMNLSMAGLACCLMMYGLYKCSFGRQNTVAPNLEINNHQIEKKKKRK